MFTNYETNIKSISYSLTPATEPKKGTKMITNIKGETLGVQVDYASPLQLYFQLENIGEVGFEELLSGTAVFEILTTTHKPLISKEFPIEDILNIYTNDLCIFLSQEELEPLKKETYNMKITLKLAEASYVVFAEEDSYLVIR
jgi:hypothetical protein